MISNAPSLLLAGLVASQALLASPTAAAPDPSSVPGQINMERALVIALPGESRRHPLHVDELEHQLVMGSFKPPRPGHAIAFAGGTQEPWLEADVDDKGWLAHEVLGRGYAHWTVNSESERFMLLQASGHSTVWVDGAPRIGDPYRTRFVSVPVKLKEGANDFLFRVGRAGRFRASLVPAGAEALLNVRDATLPDLIVGESLTSQGAVVILNASEETLRGLVIKASLPGDVSHASVVPPIPPLGMVKAAFDFEARARNETGDVELLLSLSKQGTAENERIPMDEATVTLSVRTPQETRKVTFVSEVDGSLQYYAHLPRRETTAHQGPGALFLSLHGAGVKARGQARAYAAKSWGDVIAPTNRRPFGFDWEDTGRLDALEVLELGMLSTGADPRRVYLTGHSMGGHGTWTVGSLFPDRFAAIGPSAGWGSFWSYMESPRPIGDDPVERVFYRASAASDTQSLVSNLGQLGVYVLHGEDDDNVPPREARAMLALLEGFHHDYDSHFEPGVKHWWNSLEEPGTDCLDWAPMFDFFARHARPENPRHVSFTTPSPGVSSESHWLRIELQEQHFSPSSVTIRRDPWSAHFEGNTSNVARMSLGLEGAVAGESVTLLLDEQEIETDWPAGGRLHLVRQAGNWSVSAAAPSSEKGPHRYGSFKDIWRHRPLLVHGTRGRKAERAWALAKARYDAETFWYRGNGRLEVVADIDFDPSEDPTRNVVLYGNSSTNSAWDALLGDSPVQVKRGRLKAGKKELVGRDVAALFIRPRPGSSTACVAAVSGTGLPGMRLTDRIPYFVSGVAYPDLTVLSPETLLDTKEGLWAAGFFGADWSLESGDIAWADDEDATGHSRRASRGVD